MAILITHTKVILPRRRSEILTRQRLIDLLYDLLDYRLVILAAPAGYGKTSLLIDFAHHTDIAVCWCSLDTLDQDPQRFITAFITAIAQKFPGFGGQSLATLEASQGKLNLDFLISAIANDIYDHIREHFIFVLDDYHLVNDQKDISYFISRFTQEVDENCHLVLSSRALLTLPDMPLMVARSMVGGLSFEELAFQPEEIQSLMAQNYRQVITRPAAEELSAHTEGWITGLLLSTQAMQQVMPDRLRLARVSRVGLYDYLAQQVLDQQPQVVRWFLLHSSLLEEFDISMCEKVLERDENWSYLINYVSENNLFVLPVGEDSRWIRYHHLFRDFLQARLDQEDPAAVQRTLFRLADYYSQQGEWEKAFAILKRLDNKPAMADLIENAGVVLIRNSRLALLADWIDNLPDDLLANRPNLLSIRAVPYVVNGEIDKGLALLDKAEPVLRATGDKPGLARTLSRRSNALRILGKYQEALENAHEALSITHGDPGLRRSHADSLRAIAGSKFQIGLVGESIDYLIESLATYEELGDRSNSAAVQMEIGVALQNLGRYREALRYDTAALDYFRSVNDLSRQANLLNNLGVLYHLSGEYEKAANAYDEALIKARQNKYIRIEAYILTGVGDLYSDLDAKQAALDAYQMAEDLAARIKNHFLQFYTLLAIARCYSVTKDLDESQKYLDQAQTLLLEHQSPSEAGLYHIEAGRMLRLRGQLSEATEHLSQAVNLLKTNDQPLDTARAYLLLANAQIDNNQKSQAILHLNQVLRLSSTLESNHVLVVQGREVRRLLEIVSKPPFNLKQADHLLQQVIAFEINIPSIRKQLRARAASVPFAPPKIIIQAFGSTQVIRDGAPVTVAEWQNQRRVRELFFYILSHPQGISKNEIGLEFWPDSSTSQLKLQFKNAIYRLRHALGPDIIMYDENLYWFNNDLDYEYDVEAFVHWIKEAEKSPTPSEKIDSYQNAIQRYRGPFFLDAEGSWSEIEREKLAQLYLGAILNLAQLYYEAGDYQQALDTCQHVLELDPCLEEAHRLAMRVYADRGNRANVNRQFERCKSALLSEFHAQPSPQTTSLYESLIR